MSSGKDRNRSTNYVALRALLGDLGWSDASTATEDRLKACNGSLGLIINANGTLTFTAIDAINDDLINITLSGCWTYGTVHAMALHLMSVDTVRAARKG